MGGEGPERARDEATDALRKRQAEARGAVSRLREEVTRQVARVWSTR